MPEELAPGRRIPLHLVSGSTEELTDALRLEVFLREVDRQADLFNRSFADALRAAGVDDADEVWRHIQSALFAAIVVNRLVTNQQPRSRPGWPKAHATEAAEWRVRELRRALELPNPEAFPDWPIYKVTTVRHSLEHIDERLDQAVRSPEVHHISDWYLSNGDFMLTPVELGAIVGLRAFWPEAGLLLFDRAELDMFSLDVEMLKLRNNIKEGRSALPAASGRQLYGGGQLVSVRQQVALERFQRWAKERTEVAAEFGEPVPPISITLWQPPPADPE